MSMVGLPLSLGMLCSIANEYVFLITKGYKHHQTGEDNGIIQISFYLQNKR